MNIVETSGPADFKAGIFAHSRVGKNTDPKSKVNEFVKFVENGIGGKADIATKMSFEKDGKKIHALVPEYTYDGGHLILLLLANLK